MIVGNVVSLKKYRNTSLWMLAVFLVFLTGACSTGFTELVTPTPQEPMADEVRSQSGLEEHGNSSGEQAAKQEVERNDSLTPALIHGSTPPPASSGSPLPSLKFGDVNYVYSGSAELPLGEGTDFVINGTEISIDDLERVGTTNEGNTPGIQEGLVVYRLTDEGTSDVYTFNPSEDHLNPEDGQIFKGQDVWTRWTTR